MIHQDCTNALKMATAPCGIAYRQGEGWFSYDLTKPNLRPNDTPEFLFYKQGRMPLPLTDTAFEVLVSIIKTEARKQGA